MGLMVIDSGFWTTVQDTGRVGYREWGVPVGGAFDRGAADLANALAGNESECAVLELTLRGGIFEGTGKRGDRPRRRRRSRHRLSPRTAVRVGSERRRAARSMPVSAWCWGERSTAREPTWRSEVGSRRPCGWAAARPSNRYDVAIFCMPRSRPYPPVIPASQPGAIPRPNPCGSSRVRKAVP